MRQKKFFLLLLLFLLSACGDKVEHIGQPGFALEKETSPASPNPEKVENIAPIKISEVIDSLMVEKFGELEKFINQESLLDVEWLIRWNKDLLNIITPDGSSPLLSLLKKSLKSKISNNDYNLMVNLFLKKGANPNTTDMNGVSPLLLTILKNNYTGAYLLLKKGANPNQIANVDSSLNFSIEKSLTPLTAATEMNNLEMVDLLLSAGADLNFSDAQGKRAVTIAVEKKSQLLLDYFLARNVDIYFSDQEDNTLLFSATQANNISLLKDLVAKKFDINKRNKKGETPLIIASKQASLESVEVLLSNNTLVDTQDNQGMTALHYACARGDEKMADLLLKKQANPHLITKTGMTNLMFAAKQKLSLVKLLQSYGHFPVDAQDQDGNTALLHIIKLRTRTTLYDNDVFLYLLSQNANPNIQNNNHENVLLIAAHNNQMMGFYYLDPLIKECPRIDFNLQDKDGNTALMLLVLKLDYMHFIYLVHHPKVDLHKVRNDTQDVLHLLENVIKNDGNEFNQGYYSTMLRELKIAIE